MFLTSFMTESNVFLVLFVLFGSQIFFVELNYFSFQIFFMDFFLVQANCPLFYIGEIEEFMAFWD